MANTDRKFEMARAVAEQIHVEQSLVATRMTWNLTFQGFMIASYALIAAAETSEPTKIWVQIIICLAGFVVAGSTWAGVNAASRQSSFLKAHWSENELDASGYPRPFSIEGGARLGRLPPRIICFTIGTMWFLLVALTLIERLLLTANA
jgi:hypothetical protein